MLNAVLFSILQQRNEEEQHNQQQCTQTNIESILAKREGQARPYMWCWRCSLHRQLLQVLNT